MDHEIRLALACMLQELESTGLVVELAPAPDPRHCCHFVRVAVCRNPAWYRALCERFPSGRGRGRRLPDTAIRRAHTLRGLRALLDGESAGPCYGPRLLDAARAYARRMSSHHSLHAAA